MVERSSFQQWSNLKKPDKREFEVACLNDEIFMKIENSKYETWKYI